jgi:hypothetical protein
MLPVNIELWILIVFYLAPLLPPAARNLVFHQALSPDGNPLRQA